MVQRRAIAVEEKPMATVTATARQLKARQKAKADAFDRITELMFPKDEPDQEWDHDTIELVAERILAVYPGAAEGDRTFAGEEPRTLAPVNAPQAE
jgi:hypothetical protein